MGSAVVGQSALAASPCSIFASRRSTGAAPMSVESDRNRASRLARSSKRTSPNPASVDLSNSSHSALAASLAASEGVAADGLRRRRAVVSGDPTSELAGKHRKPLGIDSLRDKWQLYTLDLIRAQIAGDAMGLAP